MAEGSCCIVQNCDWQGIINGLPAHLIESHNAISSTAPIVRLKFEMSNFTEKNMYMVKNSIWNCEFVIWFKFKRNLLAVEVFLLGKKNHKQFYRKIAYRQGQSASGSGYCGLSKLPSKITPKEVKEFYKIPKLVRPSMGLNVSVTVFKKTQKYLKVDRGMVGIIPGKKDWNYKK